MEKKLSYQLMSSPKKGKGKGKESIELLTMDDKKKDNDLLKGSNTFKEEKVSDDDDINLKGGGRDGEDETDLSKMPYMGDKLVVKYHFYINNIGEIDAVKNTCLVDVGLALIWKDHRLVNYEGDLPQKLWGPHVALWNCSGIPEIIRKDFVMLTPSDGTLTRTFRFVATVTNEKHHSFSSFPFDFTNVTMKFSQASHATLLDGTLVETATGQFILQPIKTGDVPDTVLFKFWTFKGDIALWQLVAMSTSTHVTPSTNPMLPDVQSLRVDFHFRRKPGYFGWKVIFPVLILMIASFLVFIIPVDQIADRLNYVLTALLAGFALMFVIAPDVPKTGTLTNIDKLVLHSIITILICSLVCVAFYYLNYDNIITDDDYNLYGGACLVVLYVIGLCITMVGPAIRQRYTSLEHKEKDPVEFVTLETALKNAF